MSAHAGQIALPAEKRPPVSGVSGVGLLLRLRMQLLHNQLRGAIKYQPLKLTGIAVSILLIWAGLYLILRVTFEQIGRSAMEAIVALPIIFTFFFLALSAMLTFSNAILCYGNLYRRPESIYLLSNPLHPRDIVIVKYVESLILSSWSLLLLGIPLMLAVAQVRQESWTFYPIFLGLFLLFIPLPGSLGLLLSWLVAMVAPKTPKRVLFIAAVLLFLVAGWWVWGLVDAPENTNQWLKQFYNHIAPLQGAMLPHTWISRGISFSLQGQTHLALFYLFITLANALFASLVAVEIVSRWHVHAFARAQVSGAGTIRRSGRVIGWIAEMMFAYLSRMQRLLAAKDLRTFFRDPLQWSQMAILLGLLTLYVANVQKLWLDVSQPGFQTLIGFLNFTAVSLILATITSRFVFPLVSLEGQTLWLIGMLPLSRCRIVVAKFQYALTMTLIAGVAVMAVSAYRLDLPNSLSLSYVISMVAICVGLCGVSVGMGARMPVFTERNPARIAGGFGGTISLLISVVLVILSLVGVGYLSLNSIRSGHEGWTLFMALSVLGIVLLNGFAAATALMVGIRYFNRAEL